MIRATKTLSVPVVRGSNPEASSASAAKWSCPSGSYSSAEGFGPLGSSRTGGGTRGFGRGAVTGGLSRLAGACRKRNKATDAVTSTPATTSNTARVGVEDALAAMRMQDSVNDSLAGLPFARHVPTNTQTFHFCIRYGAWESRFHLGTASLAGLHDLVQMVIRQYLYCTWMLPFHFATRVRFKQQRGFVESSRNLSSKKLRRKRFDI